MKYGPYSLGLVPEPNDLVEVSVTEDIRSILYRYYKARAAEANQKIHEAQQERAAVLSVEQQRQLEQIIGSDNAASTSERGIIDEDSMSEDEETSRSKGTTGFGESLL